MARRTRTRTVYRTRAKRAYRKGKTLLSGNTGNIIYGAAAGAASGFIPQVLGQWTNPAVFGVAGYVMKKPALLGIAGYELGKTLMGNVGGNGGGNGGFFE